MGESDLVIGKVLANRYRIDKILGQGGMGAVYLAEDLKTYKKLAVKKNSHDSQESQVRFQREYLFLKNVEHPTLIKAYDFFVEDRSLYMTMEFVSGQSLDKLLLNANRFSLLEQIAIANRLARGLEVLHQARIVHRDIKPENILIDSEQGLVKIVDLGIGKDTLTKDSFLTQEGAVLGTPAYMSPEQANGEASKGSDIFSLGVVLYQLFLGLPKSPFYNESAMTTFMNIALQNPPPLLEVLKEKGLWQETWQKVYEDIHQIVEKSLEKEPSKRWDKVGDIAKSLADLYTTMVNNLEEQNRPFGIISSPNQRDFASCISTFQEEEKSIEPFIQSFPNKEISCEGYEIIEKIGEGGMGIVYKAKDLKLQRIVALKWLPCGNSLKVRRFLREARASAKLKHPGIVEIYNWHKEEDDTFITMELIEGQSLEEKISQIDSLETKLNIFKQICLALRYAHQKGIIHRDLKPANILVEESGRIVITDFGLAKILDESNALTQDGAILGTPHYMSPEQLFGKEVDFRSDIYSLGVILYRLLANDYPFTAKTIHHLREQVVNRKPKSICSQDAKISKDLEKICFRAMAKKKSQRYSSVQRLLGDLERYKSGRRVWNFSTVLPKVALAIFTFAVVWFSWPLLFKSQGPKDPKEVRLEIRQLLAEKKFTEAERLADKARSKNTSQEWLLFFSEVYYQTQNEKELLVLWRVLNEQTIPVNERLKIAKRSEQLRYLDIAQRAWEGLIGQIQRLESEKRLAFLLFTKGDYAQSTHFYKKLDPLSKLLGQAHIAYHQGNFAAAQAYLNEIPSKKLQEANVVDKCSHQLIQLLLKWNKLQNELNQWQYLFESNTPQTQILQEFEDNISTLQGDKSLVGSYWYKKSLLYLSFAKVDFEQPSSLAKSVEETKEILSQYSMADQQLFLQVILRFYIRSNENDISWPEVYEFASYWTDRHSYLANLHHLKGLILQKTGKREVALEHIQKATFLNELDYSPYINYSRMLLMEDIHPKNLFLQDQFVNRVLQKQFSNVLQSFLSAYAEDYYSSIRFETKKNITPEYLAATWKIILKNFQPESTRNALGFLFESFSLQEMEDQKQTHLEYWSPEVEKFYQAFRREKVASQKITVMKNLLVQWYSALASDEFPNEKATVLSQIKKLGSDGEKTLQEIVRSSQHVFIRYLAANVLAEVATKNSFECLYQLSQMNYPMNLIAESAMIESGIRHDFSFKVEDLEKHNYEVFYDLLHALYRRQREVPTREEVSQQKAIIFLAQMFRCSNLLRIEKRIQVVDHLVNYCEKQKEHKMLAFKILFYNLDQIKNPKRLKKYQLRIINLILKGFERKSEEVFILLCQKITEYRDFYAWLIKGFSKRDKAIRSCLWKSLENYNTPQNQRIASAVALGFHGETDRLADYVLERDAQDKDNTLLRYSMLCCTMRNVSQWAKYFKRTMDFIEAEASHSDEVRLRQLVIVSISRMDISTTWAKGLREQFLLKIEKMPQPEIRKSYLSSLLWSGKLDDIPFLEEMAQDKDYRNLALLSKYVILGAEKPQTLLKFLTKKEVSTHRESISWGIKERCEDVTFMNLERAIRRNYFWLIEGPFSLQTQEMLNLVYQLHPSDENALLLGYCYLFTREYSKLQNILAKHFVNLSHSSKKLYLQAMACQLKSHAIARTSSFKGTSELDQSLQVYACQPRLASEIAHQLLWDRKKQKALEYFWQDFLLGNKRSLPYILSLDQRKDKIDLFSYFADDFREFSTDFFQRQSLLRPLIPNIKKYIAFSNTKSYLVNPHINLHRWWISPRYSRSFSFRNEKEISWRQSNYGVFHPRGGILIRDMYPRPGKIFLKTFFYSPRTTKVRALFETKKAYHLNLNNLFLNRTSLKLKLKQRGKKKLDQMIQLNKGWNEIILEVRSPFTDVQFTFLLFQGKYQPIPGGVCNWEKKAPRPENWLNQGKNK